MNALNQDLLHELFRYENGCLYWKSDRGNRVRAGDRAGRVNTNGYRQVSISGSYYYEHRLIYAMHFAQVPEFLDHIDGSRCNNRIENLRPATREQNMHNRKANINNTSGIKGVCWSAATKKWSGFCWVSGKQYNLGYFDKKDDAATAVAAFREKHHGVFAKP